MVAIVTDGAAAVTSKIMALLEVSKKKKIKEFEEKMSFLRLHFLFLKKRCVQRVLK